VSEQQRHRTPGQQLAGGAAEHGRPEPGVAGAARDDIASAERRRRLDQRGADCALFTPPFVQVRRNAVAGEVFAGIRRRKLGAVLIDRHHLDLAGHLQQRQRRPQRVRGFGSAVPGDDRAARGVELMDAGGDGKDRRAGVQRHVGGNIERRFVGPCVGRPKAEHDRVGEARALDQDLRRCTVIMQPVEGHALASEPLLHDAPLRLFPLADPLHHRWQGIGPTEGIGE